MGECEEESCGEGVAGPVEVDDVRNGESGCMFYGIFCEGECAFVFEGDGGICDSDFL